MNLIKCIKKYGLQKIEDVCTTGSSQRIIIHHSLDSHYQLLVKHDSNMDMLILNIHFKQFMETSSNLIMPNDFILKYKKTFRRLNLS